MQLNTITSWSDLPGHLITSLSIDELAGEVCLTLRRWQPPWKSEEFYENPAKVCFVTEDSSSTIGFYLKLDKGYRGPGIGIDQALTILVNQTIVKVTVPFYAPYFREDHWVEFVLDNRHQIYLAAHNPLIAVQLRTA
jgi:hypothetical protein